MPHSIADAKEFQYYESERVKRALETIRRNKQEWVFDYAKGLAEKGELCVFHGTHLSNVTSIRYDGLFPMLEKKLTEGEIFVVTNPISAAAHILKGGQHDTYNDGEEPLFPEIDPEEKVRMDPMILLKIDIENLAKDEAVHEIVMQKLKREWNKDKANAKLGVLGMDRYGVAMGLKNIKPEYIKAVIRDVKGKIHEVSLDDLINKVLLRNELGIYPDFLEESAA